MARVLLIDDDSVTVETLGHILRLARHEFAGALTGKDGIRTAGQFEPDIAFIDIQLPDTCGIHVLRQLRLANPSTACVVMTGQPLFEYARDAIRAGACDWLDKPIFEDDILAAIKRALTGRPRRDLRALDVAPARPHAVTRLAESAVTLISSPEDKRNMKLLGREVGHAPGCLRGWCHAANLKPKLFRDFSRALRAAWRLERHPSARDADLLAIVDGRTLQKFRVTSGGTEERLPATVEAFLAGQRFIHDTEFLAAVRLVLESQTAPAIERRAIATRGDIPS